MLVSSKTTYAKRGGEDMLTLEIKFARDGKGFGERHWIEYHQYSNERSFVCGKGFDFKDMEELGVDINSCSISHYETNRTINFTFENTGDLEQKAARLRQMLPGIIEAYFLFEPRA
ncbi:MAG: hypothetical protein US29_C0022G0002 [candidate division WS6 bacterium GW2011_GWF1_36_8]|uniref:Uncharacterized protein n=1 Tax=candidate division WS6 bacterium GW2011_GWF1_36_8 TaxID=1619098 RepID=A0A0G0FFB0_9BACT|nr:MAG: hypothetical protein US23_C0016G0002 [candidate division WS6 bacterium GW2011_GWE1_36_69]KKQ16542.1 MAG: hypothetical protein US29_C0022G0002 [candidate division WS6 bacterium GW2011_GWF1_36_8]HAM96776.1 hypothetical protein [Patescibacteria group bacterium]